MHILLGQGEQDAVFQDEKPGIAPEGEPKGKAVKEELLKKIRAVKSRKELNEHWHELIRLQNTGKLDLFDINEIESEIRDKAKLYPAENGGNI